MQDVNHYKGKNYPIMNLQERVLSVLACKVGGKEKETEREEELRERERDGKGGERGI